MARDHLQVSRWVVVAGRSLDLQPDPEGDFVFFAQEDLLHQAHLQLDLQVGSQNRFSTLDIGQLVWSGFGVLLHNPAVAEQVRVLPDWLQERDAAARRVKRTCSLQAEKHTGVVALLDPAAGDGGALVGTELACGEVDAAFFRTGAHCSH